MEGTAAPLQNLHILYLANYDILLYFFLFNLFFSRTKYHSIFIFQKQEFNLNCIMTFSNIFEVSHGVPMTTVMSQLKINLTLKSCLNATGKMLI